MFDKCCNYKTKLKFYDATTKQQALQATSTNINIKLFALGPNINSINPIQICRKNPHIKPINLCLQSPENKNIKNWLYKDYNKNVIAGNIIWSQLKVNRTKIVSLW